MIPQHNQINFLLHDVASTCAGYRLGFCLKSNLIPWLKSVSSVGLSMGCEFAMNGVVGSWFGERGSGSNLLVLLRLFGERGVRLRFCVFRLCLVAKKVQEKLELFS